MPHLSRAEMIRFARRRLTSPKRWVDALLVVDDHAGKEIFRVGGCWDTRLKKYVDRPCKEHHVRLQESQCVDSTTKGPGVAYGFDRWLGKARAGDKKRIRSLVGGGNRGSGKTWFLAGVGIVAMALAFPRDWIFGVNITAKQKRECIEAIREVAPPEWLESNIEDFRDPRTVFVTGATCCWLSAQNPRAIRQAGLRIRYVLINEGQDQPESVAINAIAAIRNTGGLVGVATNPPQAERSDWVASWWTGIEAGELNGEKYFVDNKLNRAIDQEAVGDIAAYLYATNREAGDADAAGVFKLTGPIAYPAFRPLPIAKGGHIGSPPQVGWRDVTVDLTAEAVGGGVGFPFVVGIDFQKRPGVIGQIAKLYKNERGDLVMHIIRTLAVKGVEADFSQALYSAGYCTTPGAGPAPILLVGDATGARQNSEHKWEKSPSFAAMKNDGWMILPPMRHWRTGIEWNPDVPASRSQMHYLLSRHQIMVSPECQEPQEGFPSLVESFRRAKVGPKGGLVEKGDFQHGIDGIRYMSWLFLPRPKPVEPSPGINTDTFDMLSKIRLFGQ